MQIIARMSSVVTFYQVKGGGHVETREMPVEVREELEKVLNVCRQLEGLVFGDYFVGLGGIPVFHQGSKS